ncbi:MAG TPA: hypothetical protein VN046_07620 [Stenotrophobium sp.]|jgi:hypothetical protein|nr:hypothetical protein [Stenotrophobium sp.]
MRGFKGFARAGFQKKARVSTPEGGADDFIEDRLSNAAAKESGARSHGFDLAGTGVQFFQGPAPAWNAVCPRHPEDDLRRAKALHGEGMHMAGWGAAVHAGEMFGYKQPDLGRRKVVLPDVYAHDAASCAA